MVAYSFKSSFAARVRGGLKRQTIRGHRKRHARPGEPVQLFTGMRTKHCEKLIDPDPICTAARTIALHIPARRGEAGMFQFYGEPIQLLDDAFARADGFRDAEEMMRWWRMTHRAGIFEGVLIEWAPAEAILADAKVAA